MSTPDERGITPDRWRRIEALYHEILGRPETERRAALVGACAGDRALQAEVELLLRQAASAAGTPTSEVGGRQLPQASSLSSGRRIGVFEIQGLLGAGGMGEVYRARDTRLGREVAIKVLPRLFRHDPERVARFQREARVLASLNHPHIGAIYGVEDADDVSALVMELVDGDDLSQRMGGRRSRCTTSSRSPGRSRRGSRRRMHEGSSIGTSNPPTSRSGGTARSRCSISGWPSWSPRRRAPR